MAAERSEQKAESTSAGQVAAGIVVALVLLAVLGLVIYEVNPDHVTNARNPSFVDNIVANSDDGSVSGDDAARAVDLEPEDADVYNAFLLIQKRGTLKLDTWPGAMRLPQHVSLEGSMQRPD